MYHRLPRARLHGGKEWPRIRLSTSNGNGLIRASWRTQTFPARYQTSASIISTADAIAAFKRSLVFPYACAILRTERRGDARGDPAPSSAPSPIGPDRPGDTSRRPERSPALSGRPAVPEARSGPSPSLIFVAWRTTPALGLLPRAQGRRSTGRAAD